MHLHLCNFLLNLTNFWDPKIYFLLFSKCLRNLLSFMSVLGFFDDLLYRENQSCWSMMRPWVLSVSLIYYLNCLRIRLWWAFCHQMLSKIHSFCFFPSFSQRLIKIFVTICFNCLIQNQAYFFFFCILIVLILYQNIYWLIIYLSLLIFPFC